MREASHRTGIAVASSDETPWLVFTRFAMSALAVVLSLLMARHAFASMPPREVGPAPSPSLAPDSVVAIVLRALARNDQPARDHGIATAFTFASPANREAVGPVERFGIIVHGATYRPLLDQQHAERGILRVVGARASQRVIVTTTSGEKVAYTFTLSRQDDGPFRGCWMTDGVLREPPSPLSIMRSA